MPSLSSWLELLLNEGVADLPAPVERSAEDDARVRDVLRSAFDVAASEIAGPPLQCDDAIAFAAAVFAARACWELIAPSQGSTETTEPLTIEPTTPAAHLSADLTLQYLVEVYHRATARPDDDRLVEVLANVLRRCPLSGVLTGIDEPPLWPAAFDSHMGVAMLYAERLADWPRATWWPPVGATREWTTLIFIERGLEPLEEPSP